MLGGWVAEEAGRGGKKGRVPARASGRPGSNSGRGRQRLGRGKEARPGQAARTGLDRTMVDRVQAQMQAQTTLAAYLGTAATRGKDGIGKANLS